MGRKKKVEVARIIPEQDNRICGTICVCQMVLVLSCVAIVYLAVAVYIPTYKAHTGKIDESPVMCTTITTRILNGSGSCSEWCLSKGGAGLTKQIFVHMRKNGTSLTFENCSIVFDKECKVISLDQMPNYTCTVRSSVKTVKIKDEKTNLVIKEKNILQNENACAKLSGLFICTEGLCYNTTGQLQCTSEKLTEQAMKCSLVTVGTYVVFDCAHIQGIYTCNNGKCFQMKDPECNRICFNVPTRNKNVILLSGNRMFAAKCSAAYKKDVDSLENGGVEGGNGTGTLVWDDTKNNILMASCLEIVNNSMGDWEASDCINGTTFEANDQMESVINFTALTHFHQNLSLVNPVPQIAPLNTDLTIINEVKLQINQEGCVNTLKDECAGFFKNYSANGSDYNAIMRFGFFFIIMNAKLRIDFFSYFFLLCNSFLFQISMLSFRAHQ
jgi:hypothetical protein